MDADLADMKLISKFNEGTTVFIMCYFDIFSKYIWVIPLKDKKGTIVTSALQKILDEFNHKANKNWVNKYSSFYHESMKSWLEKNSIEIYSTLNEGKSVCCWKIY